jgi:RIO kinase 1
MVYREKFKTMNNVFDLFTEKNLFKLISQGYIDGMHGPLSIGKEANIFTAQKEDRVRIVKIYRLQNCDFNKMYDYIKADPRYLRLKKKKREVVFAWAHREYRNLLKAREAGVRVPTPYGILYNILIMEFIGDEQAAPQLQKCKPDDPEKFLKEIIKQMKKLYKAGIVHGDLSGFNILNHNEKPVIIDMSQSTTLENMYAQEYLERDVKNVCTLFKKWKVEVVEEDVLKKITK